jgi:hypothetical protein
VGGWVAESLPEATRKIAIIVEPAGICDLIKWSSCLEQSSTVQKMRSVLEAKRVKEMTAGRAPAREKLLKIAEGDPRFGGNRARADLWIGEMVSDDGAHTCEKLIRREGRGRFGSHEQRAKKVVNRQVHIRIYWIE